jgi:phosphatidylethanolamine/phosphatidyl-N-methylethanolamine N-methyltransferase
MAADVPSRGEPTVVELGAGTGALTTALQHRLAGRGRHLAIERNRPWADLLRRRYPQVEVVHADVADLVDVLAERNVADVDTVVSGLPWAAYREQLPAAVAAALAPTGVFTQFAYSWSRRWAPPARAELAMLRRHFAHVAVSPTIWRNPFRLRSSTAPVGRSPRRRADPVGHARPVTAAPSTRAIRNVSIVVRFEGGPRGRRDTQLLLPQRGAAPPGLDRRRGRGAGRLRPCG